MYSFIIKFKNLEKVSIENHAQLKNGEYKISTDDNTMFI